MAAVLFESGVVLCVCVDFLEMLTWTSQETDLEGLVSVLAKVGQGQFV